MSEDSTRLQRWLCRHRGHKPFYYSVPGNTTGQAYWVCDRCGYDPHTKADADDLASRLTDDILDQIVRDLRHISQPYIIDEEPEFPLPASMLRSIEFDTEPEDDKNITYATFVPYTDDDDEIW